MGRMGCGKHGCKWVGVHAHASHELPSPQGQSGCRDRGPDSGPAGPEKEERTPVKNTREHADFRSDGTLVGGWLMRYKSRTDRTRGFGRGPTRDILEKGREEACMAAEAANIVP